MRERELFLRALDLADPAERRRFIDRACAGDAALRDGIERLLAWHARGEGWLEEPIPERLAAASPASPSGEARAARHRVGAPPRGADGDAGARPHVGGRFGGVTLLREVPGSPFGRVFAGRCPTRGQDVVVKTLDPHWEAHPGARGRFLATARRLSAIPHGGLPCVLAVEERPHAGLVLAAVEGASLAERAAGDTILPSGTVRSVGTALATALAAVHEAGLVHRALCPEAVIVGSGAAAGHAWLADTGLAHALSGADGRAEPCGAWPAFLAPEQVLGAAIDPLDHRPDLFSLGCVLAFMVTGRSPFESASRDGVLRRIHDAAPRPDVMRRIPARLAGLVGELLQADPRMRPASAGAVAARLDTLAAG
jgi:serine/threonine-protein kinase